MGRPKGSRTRKTDVPRAVEGIRQRITKQGFTVEENAKLQAFASAVDPPDRLQDARHFSREENIAQHKLYKCKWWRRDEGQLGADGKWVEPPSLVMEMKS